MENFAGRVLHAHDFRDAREFKGKKILIVGSSYSAEDIASNCLKWGCSEVVASYRSGPMDFTWPKNFSSVPEIKSVGERSATFIDGTTADNVDVIMLCTGYQHSFPFIAPS